jgi:hypothetical protein
MEFGERSKLIVGRIGFVGTAALLLGNVELVSAEQAEHGYTAFDLFASLLYARCLALGATCLVFIFVHRASLG